jgi:hypothetical protein
MIQEKSNQESLVDNPTEFDALAVIRVVRSDEKQVWKIQDSHSHSELTDEHNERKSK